MRPESPIRTTRRATTGRVVDGVNRTLWTVIGAVLALAGLAGLLAHFGALPGIGTDRVLFPPRLASGDLRLGRWPALIAIAVGLVLAGLGVLLVWAQRRRRDRARLAGLTMPATDRRGHTSVNAAVLSAALRRDLNRDPRLHGITVHLTGDPERPEVRLRLRTGPDESLAPLRDDLHEAVHRLGATMGEDPVLSEVVVTTSRTSHSPPPR